MHHYIIRRRFLHYPPTALECRKALMHAEPADVIFIAFAAKY